MKPVCIAVAALGLLAAGSAGAQTVLADLEPPGLRYYPSVASALAKLGYSEVRLVDAATREVVAIDPEGRDVLLVIHPRDGSIERITLLQKAGTIQTGQRGRRGAGGAPPTH